MLIITFEHIILVIFNSSSKRSGLPEDNGCTILEYSQNNVENQTKIQDTSHSESCPKTGKSTYIVCLYYV